MKVHVFSCDTRKQVASIGTNKECVIKSTVRVSGPATGLPYTWHCHQYKTTSSVPIINKQTGNTLNTEFETYGIPLCSFDS